MTDTTKTGLVASTLVSSTASATSTAAGRPGISTNEESSGICAFNVQDLNSAFGPVIWANCCVKQNPALNCPPQTQRYPKCPTGWYNCGDPNNHREMCTMVTDRYTDQKPLNKKCCPINFHCGTSYESPCELIPGTTNSTAFPPFINPGRVITNSLYLAKADVFAGCNDASKISPTVVGGLVAISILALCAICALIMVCIRRSLLRDPRALHWTRHFNFSRSKKKFYDRRAPSVQNLRITVMKECKVEGKNTTGKKNNTDAPTRSFLPGLPHFPLSSLWVDIGEAARMSRIVSREGSISGDRVAGPESSPPTSPPLESLFSRGSSSMGSPPMGSPPMGSPPMGSPPLESPPLRSPLRRGTPPMGSPLGRGSPLGMGSPLKY
ncbi:uncharacterized protein H6S33_004054 [Morchella sextelata]|uniref:uncharacterized protein n=1 Tax=Morchella sextelata TaxID=1174677 RepID=UPI001D04C766|nr:uncharacterized protein H6S33_004054 [Morchella sextelata]KAH0606393.1 hypothetical protein H6S33_004054 [Morchella sextelata]